MSTAVEQQDWPQLLRAAREGDDAALGEMCERLREYLLLTVADDLNPSLRAKLGASDIVQQTMLEACDGFELFRGASEAEFRSWIRQLVVHNLIDSSRSYSSTQSRDASREKPLNGKSSRQIVADQKTGSSLLRRRETDEHLLRAVARLPAKERQIIELRHRQGLAYREIAAQLKMTEVAARKLWSRTVETLRSQLTSDHVTRTSRAD